MDLELIRKLKEELKRDEGFVPHCYQDSEGYWTIGYGRLIDKRGGKISEDEADHLLSNDIRRTYQSALEFDWFTNLNPTRQRVILNMIFNLGLYKFKGFVKMIAALQRKDYEVAADEMLDSKWAKQVGRRADRLAKMMRE